MKQLPPSRWLSELLETGSKWTGRIVDHLHAIRGEVHDSMYLRKAVDKYRPHAYPGPIKLIIPLETVTPDWDPSVSWRLLAAEGLEVCRVPGNHTSMFEESNVQTVAAVLQRFLEEAKRKAAVREGNWDAVTFDGRGGQTGVPHHSGDN